MYEKVKCGLTSKMSMAQSVKVKASETDLCRVERARYESRNGLVLFHQCCSSRTVSVQSSILSIGFPRRPVVTFTMVYHLSAYGEYGKE